MLRRLRLRLRRAPLELGPSFRYKLHEARRLNRKYGNELARRLTWKPYARELAISVGVAVPRLLQRVNDPVEIEWDELPDEFVVKPAKGLSAIAVFPVVRQSGTLWSLLDQRPVTAQEIVETCSHAARSNRWVSRETMVEELVRRSDGRLAPPVDWRMYAFHGRVELIRQRDTRGTRERRSDRVRFYGPDWTPLGRIRLDTHVSRRLPSPRHPDELVSAAERLSSRVPLPFVRVDLYDSEEGPVFGEFTPYPGGALLFRADIDRALGEAWEDAEADLAGM
jgi:hypothetical protein